MKEKETPTTLEEAQVIANALKPLGYEVYGVEDTWLNHRIQGLALKVVRIPSGQSS
jgi:hypothetical protein